MNKGRNLREGEHYRALCILNELSASDSLTQRDLSKKLNIALGLVNSYLKNLIAKGYVTVKAIPAKRYSYYLTPKGFAEKTRLAYALFHDYTRIYRETRGNLKQLFAEMEAAGVKKVVFAGSDEVAEIAYITLQEAAIEFSGVVDGENAGRKFFGNQIRPLETVNEMAYDQIIVASYLRRKEMFEGLLKANVKREEIKVIFPL